MESNKKGSEAESCETTYLNKVKSDRPSLQNSRPINQLKHLLAEDRIHHFKHGLIPRKVLLDTINICNADCVFCAYQFNEDKKKIMSNELVQLSASQITQLIPDSFVSLTPTVGDPLIDPAIFEKVKILKAAGIQRVQFYTNAILLDERIEELLSSGLDNLELSISDLSEESYRSIFRSDKYGKAIKGISRLLKKLKESEIGLPVKINFRSNLKLAEIKKQADYKEYIEPYLTKYIFLADTNTFDNWMGLITEDQLPAGMHLSADMKDEKQKPCRRLVDLQILTNGDVRVCGCRAETTVYDDLVIGNLYQNDLSEIWNSKKLLNIWKGFYQKSYPEACRSCSYYSEIDDRPDRAYQFREGFEV